jgi:nicotinic acid mononucleotide adenylyltransferase
MLALARRSNSRMKKRQTVPHRKKSAERLEHLHEKIQRRAYELYELRGGDDGRDFDDWLKAESELIGSADRQ